MGRALLIWRLVIGDIKRRPVQAALLLVMIVTTTTTLTLGLALRKVTDSPFARTRAATNGPDVVAQISPPGGSLTKARAQLAVLTRARGVSGVAGPYPFASVRLTAPRVNLSALAEGRDIAPAPIDRPALSSGGWIRPGGAVLESGFASALGLHAGDAIRLNGRRFGVVGIAASTAQCFYPVSKPGVIWLTRADAMRLATPQQPLGYVLDLKLLHPASAYDFEFGPVGTRFFADTGDAESPSVQTWLAIAHDDFRVITVDQKALLVGSSLLALLALASIAVVVGGRMAEQTRRVGLLKAVGATPLLVAVVLLAENLLLALAAAAVGIAAGRLLAPVLTNPGAGLLGSPPTPPLSAEAIAEVVAVAMVVAAAATIVPAIRGARTSTVGALNDPAHPPRRRPWLIALSSRLPVPLLFGLRVVARRPRRVALTAASLTVAVAMIVATLALQYRIDTNNQQHSGVFFGTGGVADRVSHLVFVLTAILVVLAGINAIFTAWVTVIDAQRPTALTRAIGATPGQVGAGLTAAQLLPGLLGACLGIPVGLGLYQLAGGHLGEASPPLWWLLAVVPGTLIVVAALTAFPARLGATRSPAEVLRSD
ncbi:MAG TPA: FtsX-like permease family protein [Solirubrobacteraceae bacterium]|nr:FtsX-like permease family protein [Solirubrobacteraceae bacterium]